MAKAKRTTKRKKVASESDSSYLLKIVLYLIIGAQWIRLVDPVMSTQIPIPAGFIVGLIFASHDHFQVDRKIEYAVLLMAMFIGFWSQVGLYIAVL